MFYSRDWEKNQKMQRLIEKRHVKCVVYNVVFITSANKLKDIQASSVLMFLNLGKWNLNFRLKKSQNDFHDVSNHEKLNLNTFLMETPRWQKDNSFILQFCIQYRHKNDVDRTQTKQNSATNKLDLATPARLQMQIFSAPLRVALIPRATKSNSS